MELQTQKKFASTSQHFPTHSIHKRPGRCCKSAFDHGTVTMAKQALPQKHRISGYPFPICVEVNHNNYTDSFSFETHTVTNTSYFSIELTQYYLKMQHFQDVGAQTHVLSAYG